MPFFPINFLKASLGNNFGQVTTNIYRSRQPSKDRLIELHSKYDIQANINLREDLKPEEWLECQAAGIELLNYPMSDSKAPEVEQVDEILRVLLIHSKLVPTLVCCWGGRHRTGLIIACYRVRFQPGWTKEAAWKEAEDKYNFFSFPNHGALKDFFFNTFQP